MPFLTILYIASALAEPDDKVDPEEVFQISRQFASCAGLYDAMAAFIEKNSDEVAAREKAKGLANGAQLVSSYFASHVTGPEKAQLFAENLREVFSNEWEVHAIDGFDEEFLKEMEICKSLSPTQSEIIEEIRKKAYGFN